MIRPVVTLTASLAILLTGCPVASDNITSDGGELAQAYEPAEPPAPLCADPVPDGTYVYSTKSTCVPSGWSLRPQRWHAECTDGVCVRSDSSGTGRGGYGGGGEACGPVMIVSENDCYTESKWVCDSGPVTQYIHESRTQTWNGHYGEQDIHSVDYDCKLRWELALVFEK